MDSKSVLARHKDICEDYMKEVLEVKKTYESGDKYAEFKPFFSVVTVSYTNLDEILSLLPIETVGELNDRKCSIIDVVCEIVLEYGDVVLNNPDELPMKYIKAYFEDEMAFRLVAGLPMKEVD